MIPKLHLAHTPTPVWRHAKLDELIGCELWIKRDDMTGGAEAGNKIRKLEYLLAEAQRRAATTIITCGAAQSNHARATALLAKQLGMDCKLVLRSDPDERQENRGNLLLDQLAGASIEYVSPERYQERAELMEQLRTELSESGERPFVIPEGGSNGLGCLGYVDAMAEIRRQGDLGICPEYFDSIALACGSGGTAAGVALGSAQFKIASNILAYAVCNDSQYFSAAIERISEEARVLRPELPKPLRVQVIDDHKGPRYGTMSTAQQEFLARVCAKTGLVLDPVYSGKALFGFSQLEPKPDRALFIHTGGLPGLLAYGGEFSTAAVRGGAKDSSGDTSAS